MADFLSPDENPNQELPAWMLAADNHNIGNSLGQSLLDPQTWTDKASNAYKMVATSLLSGANSFYNTGAYIGKAAGANVSEQDTGEWIASIDNDLGQYYDKNRTEADLLGFIATSLIPGIGGIKVLNAGQKVLSVAANSGKLGANLSKATGLLVPKTAMYIEAAAKDITQSMNIFSTLNANVAKALGSGAVQGVLEGAAFETAAQATMFRSPILEGQDTMDIIKNIATAGLFNGVLGGALSGVKSFGALKKAVSAEQEKLLPLSSRYLIAEGTTPSSKIILNADDLETSVMPIKGGGEAFNEGAANTLFKDKQRRIVNDIRDNINTMAGNDSELGNLVADMQYGTTATDTVNTFLHTQEIARVKELTAVEKAANKLAKEGLSDPTKGVVYIKLLGEDAGSVYNKAPDTIGLSDALIPGKGKTTEQAIFDFIGQQKFKVGDSFSILKTGAKSDGHLINEARYLWAKYLKKLPEDLTIHFTDLPVLQRALADGRLDLKLIDDAGGRLKSGFIDATELQNYIIDTKQDLATKLVRRNGPNTGEIAKSLDMKVARLEGTTIGLDVKDFFAMDDSIQQYGLNRIVKGLSREGDKVTDPAFLPNYAKLSYNIPDSALTDGHLLDGITYLKQRQKLFQLAADNVLAKRVGKYADELPTLDESDLSMVNTTGSGAGLISFENGNYGTLASKVAGMGQITKQLSVDFRQQTQDALEGALAKMGQNKEASIEHATISQKITRSGQLWVMDPVESQLITRKAYNAQQKALTAGDDFIPADADVIPIVNAETYRVVEAELGLSGNRINTHTEINAIYGRQTNRDPLVYQPIRPNLRDYPYFAFVKDDRVTGSGHTTLLHAASQSKLDELVNNVRIKSPELRVLTKTDTEDYFKAAREYEYDRGLNENYLNSDLHNKGIFSEHFTKTDPQKIINDILQQHVRQDDVMAAELVRLKNAPQFGWLEDQGRQFTKIEASKFGSSLSKIEKEGKNPYTDFIKTALNVSKASEYPMLYGINQTLDRAVSNVVDKIKDYTSRAKSAEDMIGINTILAEYGMDSAFRNAATDLLVNHTAPKGELSKFIRSANGILSKLTLGLDPLNALNNFIGANILRGTELSQITKAIQDGAPELVGKLAGLTKVQLPGTPAALLSSTKLTAQALANFAKDDGTLMTRYQNAGYVKDINQQFRQMMDDFTLKGTESVGELKSRLNSAFKKMQALSDKGEKITGNKFFEELNRFVSADVMRQITDVAIEGGVISRAEAHSYINTFVNRVEGNTLASQRPIIFQGPIGQAIGLFQSYQFNLMQQMFRYVAEGSKKDAAMLLGLQGTFYGLQGLPAFQFINQHIIGTASGNKNHVDAYDAALGIMGKQAGDFLLYGLPSNILQTNLYSRGDINPRQISVIPTTLSEVPFIGAFGKFVGSILSTASKIGNGAPIAESMLQGLEHNGLSRPMAGLAQTLQAFGAGGMAYSTTSKGSILASNDLMSWATATRLVGGRPLDEAITNDAVFRIHAYNAYDKNKMDMLSQAVKASVISGNNPDPNTVTQFASAYAERGGTQTSFNRYMMDQYKKANISDAQRIASQLHNPLARKAQLLMND
jgi:hypothetical protein